MDDARARVAQVETLAGDNPTVWIALGLRHARAVLADDEQAAALFDDALGADLRRWPFQRARALLCVWAVVASAASDHRVSHAAARCP